MDPELQEYLLIAGVAVFYVGVPLYSVGRTTWNLYKRSSDLNQPATMDTPMNKTVHINYEPNIQSDLEESL